MFEISIIDIRTYGERFSWRYWGNYMYMFLRLACICCNSFG